MSDATSAAHSVDDWISREAISFSLDSADSVNAAVDRLVAALGDSVELLGLGEALHGGEEICIFRNRLFERLAVAHGYTAIAIESSFPRSRLVNEYVAGRVESGVAAPASYDDVCETGFSHGFGRLEATRELIEWMRAYNVDPAHVVKLQFYGFDSPTEMMTTDSPRHVLSLVLDYLDSQGAAGSERRERIEALLGEDAAWETPEAAMDPAKSIGLSAAAKSLRFETFNLIKELRARQVEMVTQGGEGRYQEAVHYAAVARQLLSYHAVVATASDNRFAELLGHRDAMMADNLTYIAGRERGRGKVLVFAHNSHLQRGPARWQFGPNLLQWSPAGSFVHSLLGPRYAVIGSAVGVSEPNGIASPEPGTLEARLLATPGSMRFLPTHRDDNHLATATATLPLRTASAKNGSYFPLTAEHLSDFDWLVAFDQVTYNRGGPQLSPAQS